MDIVADLMKQVAAGDNLSMISKSVGGDGNAVQSALSMGLPLIMGTLADTASKPGGAAMLRIVLAKAGGSNPLDNLGGFLSKPEASGGSARVSALFGSRMGGIQTAISQKTGLPPAIVSKVMEIAIPLVMGYVGKMVVSQKMDAAGLTSLLGDQSRLAMAASPDAAAMAQQLLETQAGSGGISGLLKKFSGK